MPGASMSEVRERDSADATYKYALLRGVIEICQQASHLREEDGDRVSFPLGLLVEKWLLYYYPIFAAPAFIPQKNGETPDQDTGKVVSFREDGYRGILGARVTECGNEGFRPDPS